MQKLFTVRVAHAILAGLQVLTAGSALANILGRDPAALIVLIVGALQVALASYQLPPQNNAAAQTPATPNTGGNE